MANGTYAFRMPKIMNIELVGILEPWVSAKDVALYILKLLIVNAASDILLSTLGW